jgi:hypothetical protein
MLSGLTHLPEGQLIEGVRLDRIKVRARDIELQPSRGPLEKLDGPDVPSWVWSAKPDRSVLDLSANKFSGRAVTRPNVYAMDGEVGFNITGLEFDAETVRAYFDLDAAPSDRPPVAPATPDTTRVPVVGRQRETEKWEAVALALIRLAADGRLDLNASDGFKRQSHLRQAILDDPDVARLDVKDETIKPFVRKVWYAVVELPA